jgi:hypothetical protein
MSLSKEPIYGNHLGIVVNNKDPEFRGRVQIWIPYLTNTLHAGWNKDLSNKNFKHIHDSGSLTPELVEELKTVLPWAECASPIFGGGTSATYNPNTGITDTYAGRTFPITDPQKGAYIQGKIGSPNNKIGHYDIKQVGRGFFERTDLDQYVQVDGSPLSSGTTTSGGTFYASRDGGTRTHSGWDFAFGNRQAALTLSNGARWVDNSSMTFKNGEVGDRATFELPDGRRFEILHGKFNPNYGGDITQPSESVAGTTVNPHSTATEGSLEVKDATTTESPEVQGSFVADKVFQYTTVGDETTDSWTSKGYSSQGQNLTPGIIAVPQNNKFLPVGTVIRDTRTNYVYIVSDVHGNSNQGSTIDMYVDRSTYNVNNTVGNVNFEVLGRESTIGKSAEDVKAQLAKYGTVPPGASAAEDLIAAGKGGVLEGKTGYAAARGGSQTSPNPNFHAPITDPGLAGDQASGMISIPFPGAKVFVFFLAGDIQKPIYFANSLEPETMKKMIQTGSDSVIGLDVDSARVGNVFASGPVKMSMTYTKLKDGNLITDTSSFEVLARGSGLMVHGAGTSLVAQDTLNIQSRADAFTSLGGSYNARIGTTSHTDVESDIFINAGRMTDKEIAAIEKLKTITETVQKEKVEQIKNTAKSGEKVPCPLCSTSYAVDRASSFAKRAFNFLRNLLPPYFSYAIDVFQFLLGLILVPFTSVVPGHVLGKCGNPDCDKGEIPSPQKPIENANKEAAKKLSSKQKEIADAEQQLGNGGSFTVTASKDVVISAGLPGGMNDAPCYAETVNKSVSVGTQTKSNDGQTIAQRHKSAEIKNVVYTPPINLPGNLMLRGGNSVQIVAGAAGIELNTKGRLKLNCGSVELLASDGEMVFGSKNHTTLKGRVVTIDANDRTNKGGVEINSPTMVCKGFSATGNVGVVGGMRLDGELSVPFLNTVGQRTQSDQGSSPDQRIPFTTWATGPAQTNDILNTVRTALTHYAMPGAMLNLTNIVKAVMQIYNTIYINTVIEPVPTGLYLGFCCNAAGPGVSWGWIWNWHHNQLEDPKPHHHDYTQPKGNYYDDVQGVRNSAVEPGPIPTKARSNGQGPDGGPKTLAGCGGFGGWGGGSGGRRFNYNKMNSFGIGDKVPGFTNTRLQSSNIRFKRLPDGNIDIIVDDTKC